MRAPSVLADLPGEGLRTRVVGDRPGQASAVKMCTASVYKGTTALWAQALQTADALGVLDVVRRRTWPRSSPARPRRPAT